MSSSSSDARLRTRNESRETRVDRIVIMHPDGMAAVPEIPQSFSKVHSFAQGQLAETEVLGNQQRLWPKNCPNS